MQLQFRTPHQYFFVHEQVKHLLLLWSKDRHRELYLVEEDDDRLVLNYPGEVYRELLLDQLGDIFFQRLETDSESFRAALAATFRYDGRLIGAYYCTADDASSVGDASAGDNADEARTRGPIEQLYFFEIAHGRLCELESSEYEAVAQLFFETFPEYASETVD
ncbi:hypothetical protein [Numidum massiliense]|uniref:hypothetical protein n=1 Tax=Numidum massiliense TaxID=1522315 RepID=UPI0006D5ACC9|nr:hypothetical protein [Numidum massiliense]